MRLMEPLGVAPEVVELGTLKRWSDYPIQQRFTDYSNIQGEPAHHPSTPFPCRPVINNKIALWTGDISLLQVDAIVNSTNETMDDYSPACQHIFARAGSALKEEIYDEVKECKTGEVRTTQGHKLPARYIIHTVGPVYNIKYQTAAQNTLHYCYRNVLHKARELGLHSIALPVINSVRRNYPPDAGAHIALRTVRRFLEQYSDTIGCVVLVLESCDLGIYEVLLPLYFPRTTAEEENARWQLPNDIGGMDGEPLLPDRQIRIIDNPQHALHGDETVEMSTQLETSVSLGEHAFTQMQGDLDRQRLLGERPLADPLADIMLKQMQEKERYERLLRRAKTEDLTEVSGIGCLYQSGVDRQGRPVVIFVGKWFPFNKINLDKVGSLATCFFAKRGHNVALYEYREDIRVAEEIRGKSINLALSVRGRAALREIGLEDVLVREHGIPMRGRMIHGKNGTLTEIPYDPINKNCIYSVNRRFLNETLLNAAEKYPNVKLNFNKKLENADLESGKLTFINRKTTDEEEVSTDLIVGADGAFSTVRKLMTKRPLFNFSQTYIEHGYMELCIPAKDKGKFAMTKNHLHIWPRGEFMMIALPNQDGSYTVTLFAPFVTFDGLKTPQKLLYFFNEQFRDAVPLLGEDKLVKDFFNNKPLPLISIKCSPFHVKNSALIIGDAAHAMVPFYGQGMNTGFEDCVILDELFEKYDSNLSEILPAFTEQRSSDAHEICDLAMYNYIEMRDLVNKKSFLLRKYLDTMLYWLLPNTWIPLYNSVHFTRLSFKTCTANRAWQEKVIQRSIYVVIAIITAVIISQQF